MKRCLKTAGFTIHQPERQTFINKLIINPDLLAVMYAEVKNVSCQKTGTSYL